MAKLHACSPWLLSLLAIACNDDGPGAPANGTGGVAGSGGGSIGGSASAGMAGAGPAGSAGLGGAAGIGGGSVGGAGASTAGAGGTGAGAAGAPGTGGSVNNVPGDYQGTPFSALTIPGKINACDYDRGGANVAWCHDTGNCSAGTVTGDYPGGAGVYRPPMPADAKMCSGAACDDNVGVCRMNPSKPDNTINGQPMPPTDTYLCYSVAGEWTKYTVTVTEAGKYSISGVMAVPPNGGGFNLSFGNDLSTGNVSVAVTPNTNSGSGENFHSWDDRAGIATVTFPAAGKYLMTLTQTGRFNAASFTFTKM
jgi:hypothetical protein